MTQEKHNEKPVVLIVDDEPTNINLLAQALHSFCQLKVSKSAEQAFEILDTGVEPDLILLDIIMPAGMNGIQACEKLKQDERFQKIPVIFTTARSTVENEIEGLRAGAIDYIIKPFTPLLVEHRVKIHLERIATEKAMLKNKRQINSKNEALEYAASEMKLAQAVFDNIQEGIVVIDQDTKIQRVNPGAETITGYALSEVINKSINLCESDRHDNRFYNQMWQDLSEKGYWKGEVWKKKKNGDIFPSYQTMYRIEEEKGHYYIALFTDISKQKEMEDALTHQANHDTLTGLPNRQLFLDRLEHSLVRSQRTKEPFAVMFIDLDKFKFVNDTMGHPAGDQLLQSVSERLVDTLRASDTVARIGGDEFTILLPELEKAKHAASIATKLIDYLHRPYILDDGVAEIGASIGIAMYPGDGDNMDDLLNHADMAMFQAKQEGRNTYRFYTRELQNQSQGKLEIEKELHKSIENSELCLVYQPIFDLTTNSVNSLEALCRWNHADEGTILPEIFIPIAEESPFIYELNTWVLKTVLKQCLEWDEQGLSPVPVNINIGSFRNSYGLACNDVEKLLRENNISGDRIGFELLETEKDKQQGKITEWMNCIKGLGIKIFIDDFGTGYSSLSYLKHYPVDGIKIDKEFIHQMDENREDLALVETICGMCKSLNLGVIAEGVETEEQLEILKKLSLPCRCIQGHYISAPISPDKVADVLKQIG